MIRRKRRGPLSAGLGDLLIDGVDFVQVATADRITAGEFQAFDLDAQSDGLCA